MHAIIPASRPRIPIEYFRACTWNPTRVFRQVPTPSSYAHSTLSYLSRTCTERGRLPLFPLPSVSGEKRRRTMPINGEFTIGSVNRNVKASSLLKNTHAHPAPLCTDQRSIRSLERNPIVCLSNEPRDSLLLPPLVSSMRVPRHYFIIYTTPNSLFALLPTRIHPRLSSFHRSPLTRVRNNLYARYR